MHLLLCVGQVQRYVQHVAPEDKPCILRQATEDYIWSMTKSANIGLKARLGNAILKISTAEAAVDLLTESRATGHSSVRYECEDPAEDIWMYEPEQH